MKITIDTKEDSHSEIKRAIELLSSLVQQTAKHSNIFEETEKNESSGGMFNMFGDNTPQPKPPEVEERPKPKPSEIDDDFPQIMQY